MRGFLVVAFALMGMFSRIEAQRPRVEFLPCGFAGPQGYEMDCGYLFVLEDRSNPNSAEIRVAFAIIHTTHPQPEPDPVVHLAGGPGGSVLNRAGGLFPNNFAGFTVNRDVILVDQRGTGFSQPRLYCPEIGQHLPDIFGGEPNPEARNRLVIDLLHQCHDRLAAEGVNLAAYNSAENAADLNDLRIALGYEAWNVFGVSYGSRLALTMMRDHPEGIRSAILDSVLPLQANLYTEIYSHFDRALKVLFAGCGSDPACNAAYPNLEAVFWETYTTLNEKPIVMGVRDRQSGRSIEVHITGDRMMDWVFNWLYAVDTIERIPRYVTALHRRDEAMMDEILRAGLNEELTIVFLDAAMHYSVQCNEEIRFAKPEVWEALPAAFPQMAAYMAQSLEWEDRLDELCGGWNLTELTRREDEAVVSDIPTLVLAGQYDPITPPEWAQLAAETLSQHYYYEIPGVGHGVVRSTPCGMAIAVTFVNDPVNEPDTACIAEVAGPEFVKPSP